MLVLLQSFLKRSHLHPIYIYFSTYILYGTTLQWCGEAMNTIISEMSSVYKSGWILASLGLGGELTQTKAALTDLHPHSTREGEAPQAQTDEYPVGKTSQTAVQVTLRVKCAVQQGQTSISTKVYRLHPQTTSTPLTFAHAPLTPLLKTAPGICKGRCWAANYIFISLVLTALSCF